MKVFRVVTERDGETTKQPGGSKTAILREEFRYAAEDIEQVWEALDYIRKDQDRTIIGIIEEAPAIQILPRRPVDESDT